MSSPETASEMMAEVARQVFEGAKTVVTASGTFRVQRTARQDLRRVEFTVEGQRFIGIEQNPATGSRWAELARAGHRVMQFKDLETNRYVANVVDGRVTFYGRGARGRSQDRGRK